MAAVAVLLGLRGFRSGRVEVDPPPRAIVRKTVTAATPESTLRSIHTVLPVAETQAPRTASVEVIDSFVPHATARAVNSWFDFESALSDVSGYREVLGEETYRQEVLRMTVEFLELPAERVPAFESTVRVVQSEIRRIQEEMGQVMAAYPVDLSDGDLRRIQSETEQRYRPGRDASLARFESFLDSSDRHREFRGYLELWVTRCCGLEP